MNWDIYKAKAYMMRVAMDLIEDGVFAAEGGRLIHEAKFNGGCDSQHRFVECIQQILEWDYETISEAFAEIYKDSK